eukprot:6691111-Pyramimonas_sp.AAC.1
MVRKLYESSGGNQTWRTSIIAFSLFTSVGTLKCFNSNFEPAVNRQSGYRRGHRGALSSHGAPRYTYLVELLGIDELEQFRRGLELVGPAGPDRWGAGDSALFSRD